MERCFRWKKKYCRLGIWNEQAGCSNLLFQGIFSNSPTLTSDLKCIYFNLQIVCIWEFRKEINRMAYAQNVLIPINVFIDLLLLLRYLRLDQTMGTLLLTIGRFLNDLWKLFLLMIILIIPYGLMQETFLYPNQYLTTLVSVA